MPSAALLPYSAGILEPSTFTVRQFGQNPDIDTGSTPEAVWDLGGPYPYQTAAVALEIVSDDAGDAAAGVGAREVTLLGCGPAPDFQFIATTVALDGLTPVTVDPIGGWFRIFRGLVGAVGAGLANVGTITVRIAGGGTSLASIEPAAGTTQMALFTFPGLGQNATVLVGGYVTGWYASVERTPPVTATFALVSRRPGESFRIEDRMTLHSQGTSTHDRTFLGLGVALVQPDDIIIPAGTDIELRVLDVSANNTMVSGGFYGLFATSPLF